MAQSCSVEGCRTGSNKDRSSYKFYRFPRDEKTLEQWKVRLKIHEPKSTDRICNLHFNDSDYMLTNLGWKVLMQGAIPSLNLPSTDRVSEHIEVACSREDTTRVVVKEETDSSDASYQFPEVVVKEETDSSEPSYQFPIITEKEDFLQTTLHSSTKLLYKDSSKRKRGECSKTAVSLLEPPSEVPFKKEKYSDGSDYDILSEGAVALLHMHSEDFMGDSSSSAHLQERIDDTTQSGEHCLALINDFQSNVLSHKTAGIPQSPKSARKNKLSCNICDKKFSCRLSLLFHLSSHQNLCCQYCGRSFKLKADYGIHVKICGKKTSIKLDRYTCVLCKESFKSRLDLMFHAEVCKQQTKREPQRRTDRQLKKPNIIEPSRKSAILPFYCSLCCCFFLQRAELRSHLLVHNLEHSPPYSCKLCAVEFIQEKFVKVHIRETHLEKQFFCETCNRVFVSKKKLELHSKHHGFSFECPECCNVYTDLRRLICHIKLHPFVLFFFCDYCELIFASVETVQAHLSTHCFVKDQPHKCELCPESVECTPTRYHVHQFVKAMKGSKSGPSSSNVPTADTKVSIGSQKQDVNEPEAVRTGDTSVSNGSQQQDVVNVSEAVYIKLEATQVLDNVKNVSEVSEIFCQDCGKIFKNESELMVHQYSHDNRGDFSCIECGKPCHSSHALAEHYEEHVKIECEDNWSSDEES